MSSPALVDGTKRNSGMAKRDKGLEKVAESVDLVGTTEVYQRRKTLSSPVVQMRCLNVMTVTA